MHVAPCAATLVRLLPGDDTVVLDVPHLPPEADGGRGLNTSAPSALGRGSCSLGEDSSSGPTLAQQLCDTLLVKACAAENC